MVLPDSRDTQFIQEPIASGYSSLIIHLLLRSLIKQTHRHHCAARHPACPLCPYFLLSRCAPFKMRRLFLRSHLESNCKVFRYFAALVPSCIRRMSIYTYVCTNTYTSGCTWLLVMTHFLFTFPTRFLFSTAFLHTRYNRQTRYRICAMKLQSFRDCEKRGCALYAGRLIMAFDAVREWTK